MSTILVCRDVYDALGKLIPTQGIFIDSAQLAAYQLYGWRLPLGAPAAPPRNAGFPGFDMSPTDSKPWEFDWSQWLIGGETITSSIWLCAGLTLTAESTSGAKTFVTVSGGTGVPLGTTVLVTNRVLTSLPRQDDQSFTVTIVQG